MKETCEIKRCRRISLLSYAAFGPRRTKEVGVCEKHWEKHCDEEDKFDLRDYFYPSRAPGESSVGFDWRASGSPRPR